jgi:tetratricopeptide (TPR) repeat protein
VLQFRNGQLLEAEASARKLRDIAVTRADLHLEKSAFQMIGLATWQQGRLDAAREAMARALCLANETGDLRSRSNFLGNLAMIDNVLGRHDDALCGYTEVLALNRESGTAETVVSTLGNLAHLHRSLAQYDDALARLNEALGICNKSGLRSTRPYLLLNFAEVHEELGNLSAAADYIARATAEARSHGTPRVECDALLLQGRLDLAAGRTEAAREKTAYAMTIADQMSDATTQIACVFNYGEIMAAEGNLVLGVTLMRWAVAQPAFGASDQRVARRLATFSSTIEEIAAETPLGQVLAMLPARQVRPRNAHETPPP